MTSHVHVYDRSALVQMPKQRYHIRNGLDTSSEKDVMSLWSSVIDLSKNVVSLNRTWLFRRPQRGCCVILQETSYLRAPARKPEPPENNDSATAGSYTAACLI